MCGHCVWWILSNALGARDVDDLHSPLSLLCFSISRVVSRRDGRCTWFVLEVLYHTFILVTVYYTVLAFFHFPATGIDIYLFIYTCRSTPSDWLNEKILFSTFRPMIFGGFIICVFIHTRARSLLRALNLSIFL
jgi:hypothetical protein